jgi:hypothetical protein
VLDPYPRGARSSIERNRRTWYASLGNVTVARIAFDIHTACVARGRTCLGVRHTLQFFARMDRESMPNGLHWEGGNDDQAEVHETIRCDGCGVRTHHQPQPLSAP